MSSNLSEGNTSIIIVVSVFNEKVIEKLLQGALDAFAHHGGNKSNILVFRVPGAFEIPGAIVQVLKHHSPDAVVAIGAVIRGETPHFDFIAGESARGIAEISHNTDIPIINGILTTDTAQQAVNRSQAGGRNKGWDAMETALKTISVYQSIRTASKC
jgi:6,7-dimethyl-8-ribityllumazine synthase